MLLFNAYRELLTGAGHPPMRAETLFKLLENPEQWQKFCDSGLISASGANSNLAHLFFEVSKLNNTEVGSEYGK
jgi:hypothetical protein